jgi:alkylation response protein AidB-like acyl-CoA dehydrogenase
MSPNEEVKRRAADALEAGGIFAFGLSERQHGADIYSTETTLTPVGEGRYVANGRKYYIGNGNAAALVSIFGKLAGRGTGGGEYVVFVVDPRHERYELVRNVVASQSFVSEFALHDYPVAEGDVLAKGQQAWDDALNTVNVGKFNLGWASIGICTHAFYEAKATIKDWGLIEPGMFGFKVFPRRLPTDLAPGERFAEPLTCTLRFLPEERQFRGRYRSEPSPAGSGCTCENTPAGVATRGTLACKRCGDGPSVP